MNHRATQTLSYLLVLLGLVTAQAQDPALPQPPTTSDPFLLDDFSLQDNEEPEETEQQEPSEVDRLLEELSQPILPPPGTSSGPLNLQTQPRVQGQPAPSMQGPPPLPPELQNPAEGMVDIRDVRDLPNPWLPWLIGGGAVLLAAIAGLVAWRVRRPKSEPVIVPPTPYEIARERLARARDLLRPETAKLFASEVSEILRAYLEDACELRARAETTEEFLIDAQQSDLFSAENRDHLRAFCEQVDLVKFAGQQLAREDMERLLAFAQETIDGIEAKLHPNPEPATVSANA